MTRRVRAYLCTLAAACLLLGCTSQDTKQVGEIESSNLRWLLRLYALTGHKNGAPKSEKQFKEAIAALDAATRDRVLAGAGVQSADELFVSERDGQPFVVFYQAPPGVARGLFAFEQQGTNGVRYVGYSLGIVEEADEQRFNELVPAAARKPQS